MKERPILFSGPMVRAILEGRKTMTRRVVKGIKGHPAIGWMLKNTLGPKGLEGDPTWDHLCPYGVPGDRLWVRETWSMEAGGIGKSDANFHAVYFSDLGLKELTGHDCDCQRMYDNQRGHWRPSIFMPRWASRITLEVKRVRVERLWEITKEDAVAEGIEPTREPPGHFNWKWYGLENTQCHAIMSFETLWKMINGDVSWDANPWVWVVEFEKC